MFEITLRLEYIILGLSGTEGLKITNTAGRLMEKKSSAMLRSEGLAGNGDHKPIWVTSAAAFGCNTRALVLARDKQNNE